MLAHDVQTKIHVHNGDVTFERIQDCTAIAKEATRRHNEGEHGSSEMRHAASFPMVIVEKYMNEKGIDFHEFMGNKAHIRAMLSDPALAAFRIWKGRL